MAEMYLISMAAEMLDMHPQTLRKYERLGLVRPSRTLGAMRVYSDQELARLRLIKMLVDEAGINLAGVQRLRPLVAEGRQRGPADLHRKLTSEIDQLFQILGLEAGRKG